MKYSKKSVVKVAENLDLNPQTLFNWVSAYRKEHIIQVTDTESNQTSKTLHEENKRLQYELKIAKQERDILKKATAYFAKETNKLQYF